ncbi:polyamine ABC transporter ATP-binding protein [Allobranchiibius huperziae]|uniref:Spermidine/putrescine import ATP-binding protein PotA n=1 Tax=Allobranchiibius huperziae TaxID=1874116 RepID=A0A853DP60_9MICO|nr:spermidine/putrescine transport system ATP-binding protein [Allobranchiibius huperziae]
MTAAPAQAAKDAVDLIDVTKQFGSATAVDHVSLHIRRNEFFSILGPSGCGKTTLMRMITGFERPTSGQIHLNGRDVKNEPANKRDLNMLFQSYALFPHLNVFDNVAFELKVRKHERSTIRARVTEALNLVRLVGYDDRKPSELSGGQKQRVALARAIVSRPSVIMLDEPLGALDQRLRQDMQLELKRLQREVGVTFIYVTHDQNEALTMSDRIAVISEGRVMQVASPTQLYLEPANRFVADFIGTSNLLTGRVSSTTAHQVCVDVEELGQLRAPGNPQCTPGDVVHLSIRPENITINSDTEERAPSTDTVSVPGKVAEVVFLGDDTRFFVDVGHGTLLTVKQVNMSRLGQAQPIALNDQVTLRWSISDSRLLTE